MALTLDLSTPEGRADLRPATKTEKQSLMGLSRDELAEALLSLGVKDSATPIHVTKEGYLNLEDEDVRRDEDVRAHLYEPPVIRRETTPCTGEQGGG